MLNMLIAALATAAGTMASCSLLAANDNEVLVQ